ncbi:uncharacterized protein [Pyxicephalus adspersus]|uniref:uncharacterized protein n=1 Tax=Pyxicephalus adspersus TaxID=30357 RepID=UPI003B5C1EAD
MPNANNPATTQATGHPPGCGGGDIPMREELVRRREMQRRCHPQGRRSHFWRRSLLPNICSQSPPMKAEEIASSGAPLPAPPPQDTSSSSESSSTSREAASPPEELPSPPPPPPQPRRHSRHPPGSRQDSLYWLHRRMSAMERWFKIAPLRHMPRRYRFKKKKKRYLYICFKKVLFGAVATRWQHEGSFLLSSRRFHCSIPSGSLRQRSPPP